MKIVVCADNKAKIEAALEEVNSKATAHTISTLTQVMSAVDEAEQGPEQRGIYLMHRPGTVAFYVPAGPYSKSYRSNVISTSLTLRRSKSSWTLCNVQRAVRSPLDPAILTLTLATGALSQVVGRMFEGINAPDSVKAKVLLDHCRVSSVEERFALLREIARPVAAGDDVLQSALDNFSVAARLAGRL